MSQVGRVEYDFVANTNDLKKKLDAAERDVDKKAANIGKGFGKMGQLAKVGLTVAGGAAVAAVASSVKSFADYQQLTGGIETLFKKSAGEMMKYANQAYKTAGMSANKYMETATSFSASLLQGLGGDTKRAAEYANKAIVAMSDNANKMGTSIESIQFAYQGFAKQNYTMLDNLKLGYGGTAEEMARLINESGVMGRAFKATAKNMSQIPFHKIIEAIGETQNKIGITGTTGKEAGETISGSFNSMLAAWDNFLVGISAGDQDVKALFDALLESAKVWLKNLVPVVKVAVVQITDLVIKSALEIKDKIFSTFREFKPVMESVAVATLAAVGVLSLWTAVTKTAAAVQAIFNAVVSANSIIALVAGITALVAGLVYFFKVTETGKKIWQEAVDSWTQAFTFLGQKIDAIVSVISRAFSLFLDSLKLGAEYTVRDIERFFSSLPGWFDSQIVQPIGKFIGGLWSGIVQGANMTVEAFKVVAGVIGGVIKAPINGIISLINNVINGINSLKVPDWVPGLGGMSANLPRIPMLASGGIVGPQGGGSVIVAGDGGENEWIVPESKMSDLIDKINVRTGGGDNITINVQGVFATSPAEQRKVAKIIAEQIEIIKAQRLEV